MNGSAFYETSSEKELNRLLTAAVVNQRFRNLLLTSPQKALDSGYNGEAFRLEAEEKSLILGIRAKSLPDFARQLTGPRGRSTFSSGVLG